MIQGIEGFVHRSGGAEKASSGKLTARTGNSTGACRSGTVDAGAGLFRVPNPIVNCVADDLQARFPVMNN